MIDLEVVGRPSNLLAERAILWALIADYPAYEGALSLISVKDFSIEKHRLIFAVIKHLVDENAQVDRVEVANELYARRQLEAVGGLAYLVSLDEGLPTGFSISGSIDSLREKTQQRGWLSIAAQLEQRSLAGDPPAETRAWIEQALTEVDTEPESKTGRVMTMDEAIEDAGGIDRFLSTGSRGVNTPSNRLTDMNNGYRAGELVIVGGNTGMGKSSWCMQVALTVGKSGHRVMIVSLEMPRRVLFQRMLCSQAKVNFQDLRAECLNQQQRSAIMRAHAEIGKWPIGIAEHGSGLDTVSGIRAALRRERKQNGDVFMLIIDFLQLLRGMGRYQNRNADLSDITRELKVLALNEQINIHLLSQLSRDNAKEKRAPVLSDLRESGSIEQNADEVQFIYRPEVFFPKDESKRGLASLIVAKQRNGPVGFIPLTWLGHLMRFEERADEIGMGASG